MRPFVQYSLACLGAIGAIGAVAWFFAGPAGRETVAVSAGVAFVVQMVAFAVARLLQPRGVWVGWGMGSAMRLIALVLYAVVVAKLWRAPVMAALLSFAAFLFVTTVIEPLFLKR